MGIVLSTHSISLDGFMAQPDGKAGHLHEWLWGGDQPSRHGGNFRLSEPSRDWFDAGVDGVGATVVGRKTYDGSDGWGGKHPFDWPFFVVTHDPRSDAAELPFVFVTEGVARAVELAKDAARDKNVTVMGGDMTRQAVAAGLLDEIDVDLVPVLLGEGVRFVDELASAPVEFELTRVVQAPGVTHISYRVVR